MPHSTHPKRHSRFGGGILGIAMLILVLAAGRLMMLSSPDSPFASDARFVLTTRPRTGLPANAKIKDRAFLWWMEIQEKIRKPRPLAYSFPASATNRCSIHGLLNQCMAVTGIHYVIAREVAAGAVQFGHANTLNGAQWATAFTEVLQTGQPEWWDSQTKTMRNENLVLVTNDATTVLVLPQEMAREFQRRKTD